MIDKNVMDRAIKDIVTNELGTLDKVNGSKCKVIIKGQVYPDLKMLREVVTTSDEGKEVLVTLIDKDRSNGVVVGVVG